MIVYIIRRLGATFIVMAVVALFLVVQQGSNAGQAFKDGAKGVADITKSLQGRN